MTRYLRVVLGYTLLALVLTWPMAAHFATHVPGDGIDDPSLAWNLWWVKHALIDKPQDPFACNWQFWPVGINLAFYTLTVLNGMLAAPVTAAFGVIPAYNLMLLVSFVLSGLGGYLLAREFLRGVRGEPWAEFAAFLAGALYAFGSSKLFYAALGQGNIASSQWAPFAALYIWRAARSGGRARDAGLAGLFMVLQAYAELTYASFLLIFAAIALVWGALRGVRTLVDSERALGHNRPDIHVRATERRPLQGASTGQRALARFTGRPGGAGNSPRSRPLVLLARFAIMGAVFALGIAPVLANMTPDLRTEGDFFTSGGGFADIFSADLAAYTTPTMLHPVLGGIIKAWSHGSTTQPDGRYFAVDKGQHIYIGYVALALALVGFWRGRRRWDTWLWAMAVAIFFLLTLGPSLRIAGHDTGIPLPFRLMEVLPFFKGNRYPSRYSVMLLLSLAPLVAGGAYALLARVRAFERGRGARRGGWPVGILASALLALTLFGHLSAPLPSSDLRVPALYERVAQEPGDFALLELPLGWRNGARVAGKQDVVIMQQLWYQTLHGKRVLGGNTSRNPEYKFQYFSEQPTLSRLIALTNAADLSQHEALRSELSQTPVSDADREEAKRWAAFTNIRYAMVHRDKLPPETEQAARDLLPLTLVAEEGPLALYRVDPAVVDPPTSYNLASDEDRMALGEGWSPMAAGEQGVDAPDLARGVFAQRQEVRLLLPLGPGEQTIRIRGAALLPAQKVTVVVDGREAGTVDLGMAPEWLEFKIPADPGRPPLSDVRLRFARTMGAAHFGKQLSRVGPLGLLVRSAGQEAGDFAHIYLDGRDVSPNGRGYNLVALDMSGRVISAANFDTHADPQASHRLANWVAGLAPGTVVAGAVRDEASMNLTQEAVDALKSLGLNVDLRGHFRWGHAFITHLGESLWARSAEAASGVRPVQLSLGFPLSEPELAAQVFEVQVNK